MPGQNPVLIMETDVAAIAAGNGPGWVSGSPANMAASASVVVLFDLGPNWRDYTEAKIILISYAPSSGFSGIQFTSRDDGQPIAYTTRRLGLKRSTSSAGSAIYVSLLSTNGAQEWMVAPCGRYLTVSLTNADAVNAQGPLSKVTLALYP